MDKKKNNEAQKRWRARNKDILYDIRKRQEENRVRAKLGLPQLPIITSVKM